MTTKINKKIGILSIDDKWKSRYTPERFQIVLAVCIWPIFIGTTILAATLSYGKDKTLVIASSIVVGTSFLTILVAAILSKILYRDNILDHEKKAEYGAQCKKRISKETDIDSMKRYLHQKVNDSKDNKSENNVIMYSLMHGALLYPITLLIAAMLGVGLTRFLIIDAGKPDIMSIGFMTTIVMISLIMPMISTFMIYTSGSLSINAKNYEEALEYVHSISTKNVDIAPSTVSNDVVTPEKVVTTKKDYVPIYPSLS